MPWRSLSGTESMLMIAVRGVVKLFLSGMTMTSKEQILKTISHNLNTLMEQRQLGVRELARECGLSPMTISRICNGKPHMPSLEAVLMLSKYFKVTVEELVEKRLARKSVLAV